MTGAARGASRPAVSRSRPRRGSERRVSVPAGCLLSNGRYSALVTAAGTGYSALDGCALTAWRADPVEDRDGTFFYLRDPAVDAAWSAGHQPVQRRGERYRAAWRPGRFEIARLDHELEARLEVCVDPDDPVEIRRLTLTNRAARRRRIEVTSYLEVVLQDAATHAAHPAFSRLFLQTEFDPGRRALLARRRPRGPGERPPWLVHALLGAGGVAYETDRTRFVGRGRSPAAPRALDPDARLSGTTGDVLDPILSLRRAVDLGPGASGRLTFLLIAGDGREEALATLDRWTPAGRADEGFGKAAARDRRTLARLGLGDRRAAWCQALGAALLRGDPGLRPAPAAELPARITAAALDRCGVPRDRALVVARAEGTDAVRRLGPWLCAYRYWRAAALPCEMLVVCDDPRALTSALARDGGPRPRVRARAQLEPRDLALLAAAARLEIPGRGGVPRVASRVREGAGGAAFAAVPPGPPEVPPFDEPLRHFNGHGGFSRDGGEYVIRLGRAGTATPTPRPWINVLANERFGCLVSETGAGSTWSGNSREHRLTPWSNDALLDPHDEALYLLDEDTGRRWSPWPGPVPGDGGYEVRHGFGYTACRHRGEGLEHELRLFVPRRDPVKILSLRLANPGPGPRRLSLFAYQRLVLGARPEDGGRFVVTEIDARGGAAFARNPAAGDRPEAVAFAAPLAPAGGPPPRFTCDRAAFLGPYGGPERPAAVRRGARLDGRAGAGLDPCFATQTTFDLPAGAAVECGFLLGEGNDGNEARELVERYRDPGAAARALAEVTGFWKELLSGVRVETPAPEIDLMVNGWLAYQALSCRLWARSAFYQSGGAYGFRDQLQDAVALLWLAPERTREQILLHAAHQFGEGDVLHWWHPPRGHGIRTRFADDLLWLPWATAAYLRVTGDRSILAESVPFLAAPALRPGEVEVLVRPEPSGERGDLYEHCCRAIDRSLAVGDHGLPRFGSGDWNDGMNRVGAAGRGESVWMAFFLIAVIGDFLPACEDRGDRRRIERYRSHRERLRAAVNETGWDGEWYRRGYYDDGTPLGSRVGDECQIDALAQAWSVLSGAAPPDRARRAMDAVERRLVSEEQGLIRLLAPPFADGPEDPGYVKGYVAGVRENGGQYTHAALWVVAALAELGRRERAARLLRMLSPVRLGATPERAAVYEVEPYVVAADVYGEPPHVGRGGWTWYTGSAGWMLRVALESVLGVGIAGGETLVVRPCVPDDWPGFRVVVRIPWNGAAYRIGVSRRGAGAGVVREARLDGRPAPIEDGAARIPIAGDGGVHDVDVVLG